MSRKTHWPLSPDNSPLSWRLASYSTSQRFRFPRKASIRLVTKSTLMSNPYAIRSLNGELFRLASVVKNDGEIY